MSRARPGRSETRRAWGIYRELAHSPGRETDDALILKAAARLLEEDGFAVDLKSAEDVSRASLEPPPCLFVMCERPEILDTLGRWEARGVRQVNRTEGIRNTYRDRTLALFSRAGIPFPKSVLVDTSDPRPLGPGGSRELAGLWIKRGDVHNTQAGDVLRVASTGDAIEALSALASRGVARAVIQEHAEGDLVKFYGVGAEPTPARPELPDEDAAPWFEWFYHRDQVLSRHPFDARALGATAARAAAALDLEIYGGDAIVAPDGSFLVIDLNAWPSFALYRDAAAAKIAGYLASRFRKHVRIGVAE